MAVPLTASAQAHAAAQLVVSRPGVLPPSLSLDPLAVFTTVPVVDPLDLLGELPPFEREAYEIQAVLGVVANELERIEAARQALILNFLPSSADALLPMFEQLLALPINPPGLTLASRQQLVLAAMRRLKGQGAGSDWEATIGALLGSAWNYQEHLPSPITNLIKNPSFEYDTVGSAPALWTPYDVGTVVVSTGWSEIGSRSARFTYTTPDTTARYLGWKTPPGTGGFPVNPLLPYSARVVVNLLTDTVPSPGVWLYLRFYNAAGAQLSPDSFSALPSSGTGRSVLSVTNVTPPPTAAYGQMIVVPFATNAAGQTLDGYLDTAMVVQSATLPTYFDGDTPGHQWSGAPGNSQSYLSSPAANTVAINIPSSLAGIAWPFIRDITPAHLAITEGYTDGFFVDITGIGGNL